MKSHNAKPLDAAELRTQARLAALRALTQLEDSDTPLSALLSALLDEQKLDGATRSFAREIATGTVRHRERLDWTLAPLLKKPLSKLDAPVRNALRLAAYERLVLDTPHAVIADEYAGSMREEKLKSAVAFVNAVARRLPEMWRISPAPEKNAASFLAIKYSHPRWLVARWLERSDFEECRDLCRANNEIAPLSLRVNTLKTSRERVLETLRARGLQAFAGEISPDAILVEGTPGSPENWPEWTRGEIIAQDEAAQIVAYIVAPKAGDFVLDVAAAPGGKATHLAQLMNDSGRVLACDRSEGRLKLVRQNAKRLALSCLETAVADLLETPAATEFWDAILLDAPCSGTGTLRRRPDAKWRKSAAQIEELTLLQRQLLDAAAKAVRVGGVLVYSTCSLEIEENDEQATAFLARHPNWILDAEPNAQQNSKDDAQPNAQNDIHPQIAKLRGSDGFWRTTPRIEYSISQNIEKTESENASSLNAAKFDDEIAEAAREITESENASDAEILPANAPHFGHSRLTHSRPDGMFAARFRRVS